ncbi:HSP70-domain-containing protein [Hesseltinella vesiculosa]|uniref:HSP70-domain-containing protein n=1 Tax=Hesseltinella vesiculosa TaxID=101127 RepID=A0A1X2GUR1_9FUNG|nr:HSP70-domain-containing protein [Hesseltinella vesiculosa]
MAWNIYLFFGAVLLLVLLQETQAAVMSIDYGTEWFKVGLIKPGMPLDVALNKDSKRKTPSVVTIRHDERIYGSDAISLAGRFPDLTYFNLKSILAKPFDDIHAEEYRNRFPNQMILDESRGMPHFHHNSSNYLTVEELIAYQFQNARSQASATAGEDVKDVVITVTPFATQHERQAILDAAELAGLNVLQLMHDETAVALNFAINRKFSSTPENHMFYDMGAGSTVASIVSFAEVTVKDGKRNKTQPQLEVKAVGFDRTLGGHEFDVRLQKLLADGFMEQNKGKLSSSVYDSQGAMTRLLKEATRVKQILSANTETTASVEGLHEEKDFRLKVTRKQLENLCADLLDRVSGPIATALEQANMKVGDIQSLVLVGGNVRIPSVQKKLSNVVGAQLIAKNVNGDEAAVLGAAFHGASLSNQFRLTKEFKIKDITSFPIQVSYDTEPSLETEQLTIFKSFDALNVRKTMTFKRDSDFAFQVTYGDAEQTQTILDNIAHVKVTGLTAALEKYSEDIKQSDKAPKVRVVFEMSPSGLLSVPEAYVSIELQDNGKTFTGKYCLIEKVKSFFGGKDGAEKVDSANDTMENVEAAQNTTSQEPQANEPVMSKVALEVEFITDGPQPLSAQHKKEIMQRIKRLDMLDAKKRLREEARNNLESFVYRTMDFLYDDTVALVASEEQLDHLREQLSEASDWLYDEGEHADTSAYVERHNALVALESPIVYRRNEHLQRDETNQLVPRSMELVQTFLTSLQAVPEEDRYHTKEELDRVTRLVEDTDKWHHEKLSQQAALTPLDEPILSSKLAKSKAKELDDALAALLRKKKPKKKQESTKPANKTNDAPDSKDTPKPDAEPQEKSDVPPVQEPAQENVEHDEL